MRGKKECFDNLLAAVRRGHIKEIRLGMETTMWTTDKPAPIGRLPRTWHVAPEIDRESSLAGTEKANISQLTWYETFGKPPPKKDHKAPPPAPVPAPVQKELPSWALPTIFALVVLALTHLLHL
jgi:hypothetical protein